MIHLCIKHARGDPKMKRSEVIELLTRVIDCRREEESFETRADNLLCHLESIGMLPPETVRYTDQDNGNTLCSPENAWDEE